MESRKTYITVSVLNNLMDGVSEYLHDFLDVCRFFSKHRERSFFRGRWLRTDGIVITATELEEIRISNRQQKNKK